MLRPHDPPRVVVVVSHPIQHFAPFYRALAGRRVDLRVMFMSRAGLDGYHDDGFGLTVQWDSTITSRYPHEFVADLDPGLDWRSPDRCRKAIGQLLRRLEEFRPDCVLVNGYMHAYALAAIAWCRLRGVPALMYSDSELLCSRKLPVRVAKWLALPPVLRLFRGFATIGDNNEAYLAHYGVPRARMFRSPYPTDEEVFRTALTRRAEHRAAVRAELAIDDDAFVALFVGKLVQRKRPLDIADALRIIAAGSPVPAPLASDRERSTVPAVPAVPAGPAGAGGAPIVAVLAGDGELRPALEAAAADLGGALRLVGFADQERLPKLYAAADVCLHPAEKDAHPLAIKEAVLCGLPVVTTDRVGSVGATDDVRSGRNGIVYPVGDVQRLAQILDDLSRRPEDLRKMSSESTNIASEIGIDATVEGFCRAFASVSSVQI